MEILFLQFVARATKWEYVIGAMIIRTGTWYGSIGGNNKSSDPVSLDLHLEITRSILFSFSTQPTFTSSGLTEMILLDFQNLLPRVPVF